MHAISTDWGQSANDRPSFCDDSGVRVVGATSIGDDNEGVAGFFPGMMILPYLRLTKLLGVGGMGSVWLADDLQLEATVAVKIPAAHQFGHDPSFLSRFVREAKLMARARGPHVVQILRLEWMTDETPLVIMERLEGEDLLQRMQRRAYNGVLDLEETTEVVKQACHALSRIHEAGIVHRDVKPENIFMCSDGFIKLVDFGIAKWNDVVPSARTAQLTQAGAIVGTPPYISPEQMLDPTRIDGRADLWALAVVAYQCLTNRTPIESNDPIAFCRALFERRMVPIGLLRPDLPPALYEWFDRALSSSIEERFSTAEEMLVAWLWAVRPGARSTSSLESEIFAVPAADAEVCEPVPLTEVVTPGISIPHNRTSEPAATRSRFRSVAAKTVVTLCGTVALAGSVFAWTGVIEARRAESRVMVVPTESPAERSASADPIAEPAAGTLARAVSTVRAKLKM